MSTDIKTIVIDDADTSRIKYTGTWSTRSNPREFGGTAHGSRTSGDTMVIQFTGSSIQVLGTIPAEGEEEDSASAVHLNFQLDSTTLPSYTQSLPQENDLYSQTVLKYDVPDGDHKLTLSLDAAPKATTPIFYLDYVLITSRTVQGSDLVFVDDTDTSLVYQGAWSTSESTHTTRDASAKLSFNFNGTYVKVVGSVSRSGTSASIDGNTSTFTLSSTTEPQTIFELDRLSDSGHQLILSPAANEPFSVDYILYRPSAGSPANSPGSPGHGDGGGPNGVGRRGVSGSVIAGIVVGVVLGLGLAILGVLWFARRSRCHRNSSGPINEAKHVTYSDTDVGGNPEAQRPFLATPASSTGAPLTASTEQSSSTFTPTMTETVPSGSQILYTMPEVVPSSASNTEEKAVAGTSSPQPLVLSWVPPEALPPIVHEDSGVRLGDGVGQREELPPAYRAY